MSPADRRVIRELEARGLVVTASQLESWRRMGLLPRHRRRGLGRGRGSVVDVVDPVVVESAAALARHLRQGRDRRLAVLEWFVEAGMPVLPGAVRVPEPPVACVREALVWVVERSVSQRVVEFARSVAGTGEEGLDALYEVSGRLMRPYRGAADPVLVRAALEAGEDVPVEAEGPGFGSVVHLIAAIGVGAQEVGSDALAEAFAAIGMFGLTVEDWARMLGAAERGEGPPVDWGLLQQNADMVAQVLRASDEELVRAREVLVGLRMFYALYVLHGLLLPDTPAQAALRQRIDDLGMFPLLDQVIAISPSPRQVAEFLALCLEPFLGNLYEALMEQFAQDPDIFSLPGDATGPVGFGETWMRTVRELSSSGRAVSGGEDDDPGEWASVQPDDGVASQPG
ncbi:hypothetical protein [Streptomyces sennicomposti]|uniref:hypothetical protein n=1 Tax=Streptomyces sennicomposti TaxID=2873384 RepID=UPI001CA734D4|nr:hypothetical protein [Streptomyces sennicomposti]MBY8864524.1 hypothetical protein [Streptomyces sennicomposti]